MAHITPDSQSTWSATIRTVFGASAAVLLVLLAFVWPTYLSKVKDLPIVVTGPPAATGQIQAGLGKSGAFDITTVSDRAAAEAAVKTREAYGAVVASPAGVDFLTASAASPLVSQALTQAASGLTAQTAAAGAQAPKVTVTDIVPLSKDDPRGAGFGVAGLPLAMGGMLGGVLISLLVTGHRRRLVAVAGYAVLAGLLLAAVLGPWLGILAGSFAAEWAIMSAALFATGAFIVGMNALIGRAGIALGAVVTLFLGNPLSALAMPTEMLPWHWGEIGQFFVPGASGTLLRLESYFPQASAVRPWLVLAAWALVGVVGMWFGRHADEEVIHIEGATTPEPVAA
ncbi:MAG: ABC transporter permease [Tetrasphaera sp.]